MSVTISVQKAPTHTEKRECVCVWNQVAEPECRWCHGTGQADEEIHDGPMPVNMANTNAEAILNLIGLPDPFIGELHAADIPPVRRRILILRNNKAARAGTVRADVSDEGSRRASVDHNGMACITTSARVFAHGIDDSYIVEKLNAIDALLVQAQQLGTMIYWN